MFASPKDDDDENSNKHDKRDSEVFAERHSPRHFCPISYKRCSPIAEHRLKQLASKTFCEKGFVWYESAAVQHSLWNCISSLVCCVLQATPWQSRPDKGAPVELSTIGEPL